MNINEKIEQLRNKIERLEEQRRRDSALVRIGGKPMTVVGRRRIGNPSKGNIWQPDEKRTTYASDVPVIEVVEQ